VDDAGAEQMIGYIVAGRAVLGAVPTLDTIIAERFFDEGGGMQLILHAPFGGRVNKAWGLALRKRFCRGFNFELQAAATDNGLNISLAEQHSFPLADVFDFLTEQTVTELLEQASLDSPIFKARWRWDAGRSLQLLRMYNGKRIAPQVQRTRSDDLLASVFPQVAACQENIEGDIQIPDHPLIQEVMKDVLTEAMNLPGLIELLAGIRTGAIRCLAVDSTTPSAFAHELINANPYAFLDDAPLEERRARAVSMRGMVPDKLLGEAGRLDPTAIAELRDECWPDIRDEHELHDLLCGLVVVPEEIQFVDAAMHWPLFFERLAMQGRATIAEHAGHRYLVAAERTEYLCRLWPDVTFASTLGCPPALKEVSHADVVRKAVQGWMALLGPVTSRCLGARLGLEPAAVWAAMLLMEMQGTILRGVFESSAPAAHDHDVEWCERRLLQRIHKRTLAGLRKQIEPVTPAVYLQWLLRWQKVTPRAQLSGEAGVLEALRLLEGFEAPAIEWERTLLPQRVAGYDPRWLDALCMEGVVGWGRISPHPAFATHGDFAAPKRVVPTSMAPVTFFLREDALWMDRCLAERAVPEPALQACLSPLAWQARAHLAQYGAVFSGDLVRALGVPAEQVHRALWELVAAGLVTADGFDSLRVLIDPRRKAVAQGLRPQRNRAGRWCLLNPAIGTAETPGAQAERREAEIESACWMLLRRYGVVFRDVLERETTIPRWRELQGMFRRLEARGAVRGGRFLSGFGGEQFAVPEAVASLRETRLKPEEGAVTVAAADPLNLAGIVVPGERPAAVPGKTVTFLGGALRVEEAAAQASFA
jgi:ATP-dependent Lhr-like helicase